MRKLSVDLVWDYLNTTLLKEASDANLAAHAIPLPISRKTAYTLMLKCNAGRCDTKKTYYNDHHQHPDVIAHRLQYISVLKQLQRRMRVWVVISASEEARYRLLRSKSSFPDVMPDGEELIVNEVTVFVHHMDDQDRWGDHPVLHPLFEPGDKPPKEEWSCDFGHDYEKCLCHLELREYGQDESVYRSGDHPSMRWGIDGRSYAINKSQGQSEMASAFKDYSKRGLGLAMSTQELVQVNTARNGKHYFDGTPMLPDLKESPGLRIINPTKAADGYWNYEKMAVQTEDVMHALQVLEPTVQQLHQYDWSSGHKKGKEGGLAISSMNFNYGGKGGKSLRDTALSDGSVGEDETMAMMYELVVSGPLGPDGVRLPSMWSLIRPPETDGTIVIELDCRVRDGDTQSMSFGPARDNPPPPFYDLRAPHDNVPLLDQAGNQMTTKKGKPRWISGYAGKAKGIKQILWERGLWKDNMKAKLDHDDPHYPQLSAQDVLANCEDFAQETGAMQELVGSYGNIVLFSSKGHPEIAGCGIEYDWGVSKKIFRRDASHVAKDCERDVRLSLDKITLTIAKHTARKARSYMQAYLSEAGDSHLLIEKFVQIHKCHRNILDQETAYLEKILKEIGEHVKEVNQEKMSLCAEKAEENRSGDEATEQIHQQASDDVMVPDAAVAATTE